MVDSPLSGGARADRFWGEWPGERTKKPTAPRHPSRERGDFQEEEFREALSEGQVLSKKYRPYHMLRRKHHELQ